MPDQTARWIQYFREQHGWDYAELSRRCRGRPTHSHIGQIEHGFRNPNRKTLRRLANALGTTIQELESGPQDKGESLQVIPVPIIGDYKADTSIDLDAESEAPLTVPADRVGAISTESLIALRVSDNSLEPEKIFEGSYLVVQRGAPIEPRKLYLLLIDDKMRVARCHPKGNLIQIIWRGRLEEMRKTEVNIVGEVIWVDQGFKP